jgi:hypothetical protein
MLSGPVQFSALNRSFRVGARTRLSCRLALLTLGLTALVCAPAMAGGVSPADELLRYIPGDAGFCLVGRDLRAHGQDLADSPFVAALRKTPAGEAVARADEMVRLSKFQGQLQEQLGLDWVKLRDDIFGAAIALAYWPGPPGKPEDEAGLILIRARVAKTLSDLVDRLNQMQKDSGEVREVEQRSHRGLTYFVRVERDKPPTYYRLQGPVLILTGKESLLLRALDLERSTAADAEPAVAREFRLLGAARSVVAVWINPRAFDAHVRERCAAKTPEQDAMKTFERYWKALDGAAVTLDLEQDASVALTVRCHTDQLPTAARRFFAEAARPSDLWQAFPDHVLVAAAARLDFAALVEAVGEFLPSSGHLAIAGELNRALGPPLGKDFVKEVLPCIGPDIGFCMYAPAVADKNWCPQGFAALKVSAGDPSAPVDQALLTGLQAVAMLAVVAHNSKDGDHPLTLKTLIQDKREVKYLSGDGVFPPGLQPAFSLHSGYLVAATSPTAMARFSPASAPRASDTVPLVRIGFREWREYLKTRLPTMTAVLAEKEGLSPDEVRSRLEGLAGTLEVFDSLEVSARPAPGQAAITVRLHTAQPLKRTVSP